VIGAGEAGAAARHGTAAPACGPDIRVLTAAEAAERDLATITGGVPARALMQRAGAAAAGEILERYGDLVAGGVAVFAGTGNNGGDAWVVARALAAAGVPVRVTATGEPRTDDARAEHALALAAFSVQPVRGDERVVVDGVLGTGSEGRPRGVGAECIARMRRMRDGGAVVVALDVPSGLDATLGPQEGALRADCTLSFGAFKRGHLLARDLCGQLVLLDIGLARVPTDDAPRLVTAGWVRGRLPALAADSHKGTRRKVAIIGGADGMAGAAVLAARAAMASGAGMVRVLAEQASVPVVQALAVAATAAAWPTDDAALDASVCRWADAVVVGPGLGRSDAAHRLLERVLRRWHGPLLLDADALNAFAGRPDALRTLLGERAALLTPHLAEFVRVAGGTTDAVRVRPYDAALDLARRTGASVLLKGVPTVVAAPDGRRLVSATGNPVLATAGSGDLLSGIAVTLLAQMSDAVEAGAAAAWVHGRAGDLAARGAPSRGVTLEHVLTALSGAWPAAERPRYPVLAELPAVGEGW
jgi:NAD(P)H-hydrate epimerase